MIYICKEMDRKIHLVISNIFLNLSETKLKKDKFMTNKRKGVVIYDSWFDVMINVLTPEQTIEILRLIRAKSKGEDYEIKDDSLRIHWFYMSQSLDASIENYEIMCKKRSDSGKMGGAPKGNKNASKNKQNNQNQPNEQKQAKNKTKNKNTHTDDVTSTQHLEDVSYEDLFNN